MTDQTAKHVCPECGGADCIIARVELEWIEGRWQVAGELTGALECTACSAEFDLSESGLSDPLDGLGYPISNAAEVEG